LPLPTHLATGGQDFLNPACCIEETYEKEDIFEQAPSAEIADQGLHRTLPRMIVDASYFIAIKR
jgi:hypothetical protein